MSALVFGATGLTGQHVVRIAEERGLGAVAHVRPGSASGDRHTEAFEELGATVERCPWERDALRGCFERHAPTVVFALLGTTKKRGRAAQAAGREETYETVDYGLTKMALDAAVESGRRPKFVYLSSMGVGPKARGGYLQVRHRLETELRASGLPWVIARPSFIHGDREEQRPGEAIGAAFGDGALALVGALGGKRLRERYRSQTGEQLATALVDLAMDPAAVAELAESDELRRRGVR